MNCDTHWRFHRDGCFGERSAARLDQPQRMIGLASAAVEPCVGTATGADSGGIAYRSADLKVGSAAGRPARVQLYRGKNFGGSGAPTATDLDVLGGPVLADEVYVG